MNNIVWARPDGGVSVTFTEFEPVAWAKTLVDRGDIPADWIPSFNQALPADRMFRDAWEKTGATLTENIPKAKLIAHDMRRAKRQTELAPLDLEATIPAKAAVAEAKRQVIRDTYAVIQTNIDAAPDTSTLKALVVAVKARP